MSDKKNLNPDDFEGYGQEIVDLVTTVNDLSQSSQQLEQGQQRLQTSTAELTQEKMFERLDGIVPDWEKINKDPDFLNWLRETDSLTGAQRQRLLDDAMATFDVQRVTSFFTTWPGGGRGPSGPGPAGSPSAPTITKEQYLKAMKDVTTERMTHEEFQKLADQYQRQFTAGR